MPSQERNAVRTCISTVAGLLACLSTSPAQDPRAATQISGTSASDLGTGLAFSPMNYGAIGDGVADDRAAVVATIDAAIAAGGHVEGGDNLYGSGGDIRYT